MHSVRASINYVPITWRAISLSRAAFFGMYSFNIFITCAIFCQILSLGENLKAKWQFSVHIHSFKKITCCNWRQQITHVTTLNQQRKIYHVLISILSAVNPNMWICHFWQVGWFTGHIPNMKTVKNLSLVVLHCTFTMCWPKVHSIS